MSVDYRTVKPETRCDAMQRDARSVCVMRDKLNEREGRMRWGRAVVDGLLHLRSRTHEEPKMGGVGGGVC